MMLPRLRGRGRSYKDLRQILFSSSRGLLVGMGPKGMRPSSNLVKLALRAYLG
jgi:hypothetical protein